MSGDTCPGCPGGAPCSEGVGPGMLFHLRPVPWTSPQRMTRLRMPRVLPSGIPNLICPAAPSNCSRCLAPYPNQPTLAKVGGSVASRSHAAPRALAAVGTRVCTAVWPKSQEPRVREPMGDHTGRCFVSTVSSQVCLFLPPPGPAPTTRGGEPSPVPSTPSQSALPSVATRGHPCAHKSGPGASAHSSPGLPPPWGKTESSPGSPRPCTTCPVPLPNSCRSPCLLFL